VGEIDDYQSVVLDIDVMINQELANTSSLQNKNDLGYSSTLEQLSKDED
jgi:hypothetical protein